MFSADTFQIIPLVGKRITPTFNPDSWWVAFLTPVMIWYISQLSLSFLPLIELLVSQFFFKVICAYLVLCYPFYCLIWGCGPLLVSKVLGNIWYVNPIFHICQYLLHNLLGRFLLFLVHLLLHVLCRNLGHWNTHLFWFCGHHGQCHICHAFWSGLIRGC